MAQIIKHRRGTAAQLKTVTLQKAELGVSTGSVSGITTPVLHVGDGTNAAGFVVGRLFQGSTVPTLNSGDIGSALQDMLFHDSATYKLYKLNSGGNENLDLTGNIANRAVTGSLTLTGAVNIEGAATSTAISASGEITASNILASGTITGTSLVGTLGTAAQSNVTSLGTLTTLTVDNVIINGTTIGHTSDTDLLTVASGKLTVAGDLDVMGSTTFVSSSQVDIGDRIIELNATNASGDGGIYVRDTDTAETGSLLWDVSEDRWIGGLKDSEVNLVTISSTDTLTNKTLTSPDINTPDLDGGTIDGATIATSNITVGSGKSLDVSGGTLTLAADQISGDKVEGGTIAATTITTLTSTTIKDFTSASGSAVSSGSFGRVDATSFHGDGSSLTGVADAAAISGSWRGELSSSAVTVVGGGVSGSALSSGSFARLDTITTGSFGYVKSTGTGSFGRVEATTLNGTLTTAAQTNITSVGTIGTGTWEGTTIAVAQGGTGATTLDNLITLSDHTTGNYVATLTGGTGITSTGATSGEGIAHSISVDASQTQITAIGTIATGVWNGTAIASAYLDADTAHLTTDQTFSGKKTFSAPITASSHVEVTGNVSGSATSTGSFGHIIFTTGTIDGGSF